MAWGVIAVTLDVAFWRSLDEIAGLERRSIEAICDGITTGAPRLRAASLERALEAYAVQAIMRRGAPLH